VVISFSIVSGLLRRATTITASLSVILEPSDRADAVVSDSVNVAAVLSEPKLARIRAQHGRDVTAALDGVLAAARTEPMTDIRVPIDRCASLRYGYGIVIPRRFLSLSVFLILRTWGIKWPSWLTLSVIFGRIVAWSTEPAGFPGMVRGQSDDSVSAAPIPVLSFARDRRMSGSAQ
jgi:hypothetical protein